MFNINKLPPKFDLYILKSEDKDPIRSGLKTKLDTIFSGIKGSNPLSDQNFKKFGDSSGSKDHVVEHKALEGWIIKGTRHDNSADKYCTDSNIYRVRKATKIENLFKRHGLSDCCRIPKKYLYQHKNGEWYVVAEKIKLTKTIRKTDSALQIMENTIELSPKHARAIALATYEAGLQDAYDHNLAYDEKENLVFFDTEPRLRDGNKNPVNKGIWNRIMGPIRSHLLAEASTEVCIFRVGTNETNCNAIREVQNQKHYQYRNSILLQFALAVITIIGLYMGASRGASSLVIPLKFVAVVAGGFALAKSALLIYFRVSTSLYSFGWFSLSYDDGIKLSNN